MNRLIGVVLILFGLILVAGCGGGGGGDDGDAGASDMVTVTGNVVDSAGAPVSGATVTISSDPVHVQTDAQGVFTAQVTPGHHEVSITKDGVTFGAASFEGEAGSRVDLGTLRPTIPYYPGGEARLWYRDQDGDRYSDGVSLVQVERPAGYYLASELLATSGDCNDSDSAVHPGAAEICGNGIDEDCSGADAPCGLTLTWYRDRDGDRYSDGVSLVQVERPAGYYLASELLATSGDCNDSDGSVHPGAAEICGNGIDEDCSGADKPCVSTWDVRERANILEIAYGAGVDFPQYAALHLESGYLRLNYGPGSGWGTSVSLLPSFWEVPAPAPVWEETASPGALKEVVAAGESVFARTSEALYRSKDLGATWQRLLGDWSVSAVHALDVDRGNIYVGTPYGVLVSFDNGESFSYSFAWAWDESRDVDFLDGWGWVAVDMWGSLSGPNRKTPDGGWELRRGDMPWPEVSTTSIVADPLDPGNVVYADQFMTTDGGSHWINLGRWVIFTTILDGASIAMDRESYSEDRGVTWRSLGLRAQAFAEDGATGYLFAARGPSYFGDTTSRGVYVGRPGEWRPFGLNDRQVLSLAVSGSHLVAVTEDGRVFRTDLSALPAGPAEPVLRQGGPVSATWVTEGGDLVVSFAGTISALRVKGTIRFKPPAGETFSAQVTTDDVSGDVSLADRPGEAFKPIFLSSMHISADSWDAQTALIGDRHYAIPASGWIVHPPVESTRFGLIGGTSTWKRNAPTIEVIPDEPWDVTGWVTLSEDPNDDNVGLWAASDQVLRSWRYMVTARP